MSFTQINILTFSTPNAELLQEELVSALGTAGEGKKWYGFTSMDKEVLLYLAPNITPGDINRARRAVEQHDPARLTNKQQLENTRKVKLDQLRQANTSDLTLTDFDAQPALIRGLAQKVAWLEQELAALRGG
jgi:hypothetical protein